MLIVHLEPGLSDMALRREHSTFPLDLQGLHFSAGDATRADWLVIVQYVSSAVVTSVPRQRRILVITEPTGVFPSSYINQFGVLVSPFNVLAFRGVWFQSHGALTSFFGLEFANKQARSTMDYQGLVTCPIPQKRDSISAVVSTKSVLPGHRDRLRFVQKLSAAIGPRLELYGHGFRDIADKSSAILPTKYHLVLENAVMPSFWTEKLADAYLGHALPIVSGPPDLGRWFPEASFVAIDIEDPSGAIEVINRALNDDLYSQRVDEIAEARKRVLRDERICPLIARVIASCANTDPKLPVPETILPLPRRPFLSRAAHEVARIYWQVESRISLRDLVRSRGS